MKKALESILVGILSTGFASCEKDVDPQIGIDYTFSSYGKSIRQRAESKPGDCLIMAQMNDEPRHCIQTATATLNMCIWYTDINNNGQLDLGIDKILPESSPSIYYCLNQPLSKQIILK